MPEQLQSFPGREPSSTELLYHRITKEQAQNLNNALLFNQMLNAPAEMKIEEDSQQQSSEYQLLRNSELDDSSPMADDKDIQNDENKKDAYGPPNPNLLKINKDLDEIENLINLLKKEKMMRNCKRYFPTLCLLAICIYAFVVGWRKYEACQDCDGSSAESGGGEIVGGFCALIGALFYTLGCYSTRCWEPKVENLRPSTQELLRSFVARNSLIVREVNIPFEFFLLDDVIDSLIERKRVMHSDNEFMSQMTFLMGLGDKSSSIRHLKINKLADPKNLVKTIFSYLKEGNKDEKKGEVPNRLLSP